MPNLCSADGIAKNYRINFNFVALKIGQMEGPSILSWHRCMAGDLLWNKRMFFTSRCPTRMIMIAMMNRASFMFVFGLAKCAILPSTRRNGNENRRASHDVFSASNLFLNIEKVLQTESQPTTKAAHSFSRKAKQRRVNEQKLKPVWAWVTDGKCSCRAEGEKKKQLGRGWLSSSLGELVTSTTIYEPAIVIVHPISCPSLLPSPFSLNQHHRICFMWSFLWSQIMH